MFITAAHADTEPVATRHLVLHRSVVHGLDTVRCRERTCGATWYDRRAARSGERCVGAIVHRDLSWSRSALPFVLRPRLTRPAPRNMQYIGMGNIAVLAALDKVGAGTFSKKRRGSMPPLPMRIDAHLHYVPPTVFEDLRRNSATYGVEFVPGPTPRIAFPDQPNPRPIVEALYDLDGHLAYMRDQRIDRLVVGPLLDLVGYSLEPEQGAAWSRLLNERMAEAIRDTPCLAALATVPMQMPADAARELRYAVEDLGLRGAMIDTNVRGRGLGADDLLPFWETADALGAPVVLHPFEVPRFDRFAEHYLHNVIGYPLETTLAAAELIFNAVLQRFPRLNIVLVHGGGFLPYQIGRFDRAFRAYLSHGSHRPRSVDPPHAYLRRFYYDTLTHDADALRYAVEKVGADRVILGSDRPFGMGDPKPARVVEAAGLNDSGRDAILGGNAARLFAL
jgi:aminocarboxymuconate-semialdehyde decarboxylase